MFNATPPNHTIATISDTTILRFHIAILKKERMRSVNFDQIIRNLGQRDDLHAENDGEGGECPRGIEQCLARSNSHSIGRESIVATMPLQESLSLMAITWSLTIISALNPSTTKVLPHREASGLHSPD